MIFIIKVVVNCKTPLVDLERFVLFAYDMVMLFMAHARKKYACVTIQMTLSSMRDWHRSEE